MAASAEVTGSEGTAAVEQAGRRGPQTPPGVWFDTLHGPVVPRPALAGDTRCDVAIIGAGFTGLWTAYYLKKAEPSLRVVVVEREVAGFGASGRNGGWCHPSLPVDLETLEREAGRDQALAMPREMFNAIDEVGRVAAEEGIDAHYHQGGMLSLATAPEQLRRAQEEAEYWERWGFGDAVRWLDADEVARDIRMQGCLGGTLTSHSAVAQPAALVRGLADAVERRGVAIHEGSLVREFGPRTVRTGDGTVHADYVVRATEGYTTGFSGQHRHFIPIYSLMIATEPLADEVWEQIGWRSRATFGDARHLYIYAARTPDGRIAIGGRGAPYHYGSRIGCRFESVPEVFEKLRRVLVSFFPILADVRITHRWGGPLAIPRDWHPSVAVDRATGLAWAGGYVGDGVATSNLCGRILADLLLERQTELTHLPLVGHRSPLWEPEPLRWLGVHTSMGLLTAADRCEARTGRPAPWAATVKRVLGV